MKGFNDPVFNLLRLQHESVNDKDCKKFVSAEDVNDSWIHLINANNFPVSS